MSQGAQAAVTAADVSFEEALKKLETIVEAMESDDLPLDQLIQRFEEGAALAKLCQDRLGEAELKVRRLEEGLDGTLSAQPVSEDSLGSP
ncbi:MAG: exodeoxyribonuclease VII small subunit [Verrucomicrobiota bacterium]